MTDENPVQCETSHAHVRVTANGGIVADTRNTLLGRERGHKSVWYIPPGGMELENAAWSYETPFPQAGALKGYLAFYPDRMKISINPDGSDTESAKEESATLLR